ncbi:MAG: PilZ domain-containing protein [Kofleriaceae bacterium]|nr:PilZ domain-containing protein [Kofleriaceae bacterium]
MRLCRAGPERRRDVRVAPKGTVRIVADTYNIRGRIMNLSRGGLAVRTPSLVPERLLGSKARIELRLDNPTASWFGLIGTLKRVGSQWIAVSFDAVPLAFGRIIENTTYAAHRNERHLSMVLVDPAPGRRDAMAQGFRDVGCHVIATSTPLEAIVRLNEAGFEPNLVAVADSSPSRTSDELRQFIVAEHPSAKLVAIGDVCPVARPDCLSANERLDDLAQRIRRLLAKVIPVGY